MPSAPLGTFGQACKQCQKCYKQESPDLRLLTCSQCRRCHYCSRDCQKADWSNHKAQCNLNKDTNARLKELEKQQQQQQTAFSHNPREVGNRLKKWIQVHRPLINNTVIHALSLQRTPDMCMTHVLTISLKTNFTASSSNSQKDIARSFLVQTASVWSFNEASEGLANKGPQYANILTTTFERSIAIRSEGGVGMGVAMIFVPEVGLLQVSTFGILDMLDEGTMPLNKDWENNFKDMVAKGIVL